MNVPENTMVSLLVSTMQLLVPLKSLGTVLIFAGVLITLPAQTSACPLELPMATVSIQDHILTVELAATPAARVCGLSRRDQLQQNQGMLFIFPDRRPRNFWMKDTYIPLSIAFLDDTGRIFSIQDMDPIQTKRQYASQDPAAYALEVNRGWFRRHGIEVGDLVQMKLPLVLDIR